MAVPRPVSRRGIPDSASIMLTYSDLKLAVSSGGVPGGHVYRLNSLFDPDQAGVGLQPAGFDEYANLYNRYLVKMCEVDIEIQDTSGISSVCCVSAGNTSSLPGSVDEMRAKMSNPYCWHGTFYAGAKVVRIKRKIDLAKLTGVTKTKYNADDKYQSSVTNNPSEILDLAISHVASALSGNVSALYKVVLNFDVYFYDRKDLALS